MYDYIMKHEGGLVSALRSYYAFCTENLTLSPLQQEEETARNYFRQIVAAIQYCHRLHVVHRDLKPENVVFFEKLGMVKLTDFGFSNKFNPGQRLQTSCGSLVRVCPTVRRLFFDSLLGPLMNKTFSLSSLRPIRHQRFS